MATEPPDDLSDRRFGWALDTIADAGPRTILNSVITTAITTEGVDTGVVHADTTSKSVYGEYEQDSEQDDLTIAKGYSRDGNRHLKQFNIGLGVTHRGVPVVGEISAVDRRVRDRSRATRHVETFF